MLSGFSRLFTCSRTLLSKTRNVSAYSGADGSYSSTGALLKRPIVTNMGSLMVLLVVIPSIYSGAMISKSGASFLEENEIFVPEDDD